MFYIILIIIVGLIIYGIVNSCSQKVTPSKESEFSLTRPFSQSAIDYSNSLPNDIENAIDEYQHLVQKINSMIDDTITRPNTSSFSFDIFAAKDSVFFEGLNDWSNHTGFDIVNFKALGYKDVYDSTKLEGIVYACFRKIHNECLRGNEKVEHYTVSNGGEEYDKYTKQSKRCFRIVVTVKKPPEPELKKLYTLSGFFDRSRFYLVSISTL